MLKILYVIPFLAVSYVFMKNAMHMFQQNRYEFYRYTKWLMSFKAFFLKEAVIYSILMVISFVRARIILIIYVLILMAIIFERAHFKQVKFFSILMVIASEKVPLKRVILYSISKNKIVNKKHSKYYG